MVSKQEDRCVCVCMCECECIFYRSILSNLILFNLLILIYHLQYVDVFILRYIYKENDCLMFICVAITLSFSSSTFFSDYFNYFAFNVFIQRI